MNRKYFPYLQSLLALLAFGIAGYALASYASGNISPDGFVGGKIYYEKFVVTPLWHTGLWIHAVFGSLALISGGIQWVITRTSLRQNKRKGFARGHRALGIIYLSSILVSFVGAMIMVPDAMGGNLAKIGFLLLDLSWLASTIIAIAYAIKKNLPLHRAWMIRSFALTAAAITLRIYLPLSAVFGFDFIASYTVISWLCWVPNLFVAEIFIRHKPKI